MQFGGMSSPNFGDNISRFGQQLQARLSQLSRMQSPNVPQQHGASPPDLRGNWRKDRNASDLKGMSDSLDVMKLGGVQKKAALILMDGIDISQDQSGFTAKFVTRVPFFRPTERYSFKEPVQMSRRDQRKGTQTAVVSPTADGLEVDVTWGQPEAGGFKETYTLPESDVLHIASVTTVGDRTASSVQVYRK